MAKAKETKGWTMIYKTLHRKLRIEQHESHYKLKVNSVVRKDKQFMLHENLTNIAINVQTVYQNNINLMVLHIIS
jgi:hypothetical protein